MCVCSLRSAEVRGRRPNYDEDESVVLDQQPAFIHKPRNLGRILKIFYKNSKIILLEKKNRFLKNLSFKNQF